MRRHTSIDLDGALVDLVKRLGGHGAISKICNEALRVFVERRFKTEFLTPDEVEQITSTCQEWERTLDEEATLRRCWNDHIKLVAAPALLKYGPTRKVICSVTVDAGGWLRERNHIVPPAARIEAAFRKFALEEPPGWREEAYHHYLQERRKATSLGDDPMSL